MLTKAQTSVTLTPCVPTLMDPMSAAARKDIRETGKTVQVLFIYLFLVLLSLFLVNYSVFNFCKLKQTPLKISQQSPAPRNKRLIEGLKQF